MWYEIWDKETRNILTWHPTEAEALAVVAATVARHGRDAVASWVLAREDGSERDEDGNIAAGDALIDRALHAPAHDDD